MNKLILIFVSFLAALLLSCSDAKPKYAPIPQGSTVLILGNSLSYGTGANQTERVKWSKQLTAKEIKKYTLSIIFSGWIPG